ncbi:hypothetical protein [Desulfoluna butyratoxydans]|uniref:Uncharacterized protein n=1 Tax=Desulfoluna butyratoxydans TaxID=231438 RepID=A0A4U8YM03_9BACT|nr:hypothetical protein [Desulfoluna butyratoxydans]VFQ44627.1 hypothetical protein MSL71_22760 [Desulfoluna butyratoxydans]
MIPCSQINFPWSGDVVQSIDPDVFFGAIPAEAGDGRMEKAIVSKASYGRQLGLITEVLISLVEEVGKKTQSKDAFKDLKGVQEDTEKIKKEMRVATRTAARRLLERLSQSDPDALDQILKEFSARS